MIVMLLSFFALCSQHHYCYTSIACIQFFCIAICGVFECISRKNVFLTFDILLEGRVRFDISKPTGARGFKTHQKKAQSFDSGDWQRA
jgi:hypothetical protein